MHAHRITVENLGMETVQLLERHWYIWDSSGVLREVQGDGVVGRQPVLPPKEYYQYVSGCPLTTDMGKMYGSYLMKRLSDDSTFEVEIPAFYLLPPFKLN